MKQWQEQGLPENVLVLVNLSRRQLDNPALPDSIRTILIDTRLSPRSLGLEITESLIMAEPEKAAHTLQGLRKLDLGIEITDALLPSANPSRADARLVLHTQIGKLNGRLAKMQLSGLALGLKLDASLAAGQPGALRSQINVGKLRITRGGQGTRPTSCFGREILILPMREG